MSHGHFGFFIYPSSSSASFFPDSDTLHHGEKRRVKTDLISIPTSPISSTHSLRIFKH